MNRHIFQIQEQIRIKNTFIGLILFILLASCITQRDLEYLQGDSPGQVSFKEATIDEYRLKPDDELYIQISSIDDPASNVFSATSGQQIMNIGAIQPYGASLVSYKVSKEGFIFLPVIDPIPAQGKTVSQVGEAIRESLSKILNQPMVTVKLVNRFISVLGEVKNPGHFAYSQDKLTIFDALGLAGDISEFGNRKEVVLTRNENGENIKIEIDLTRSDILSSGYYYMRPNDLVYVKPMHKKFWGMKEFPYNIIISSITAAILFYSVVK
jgi:polysaccharide export outer membrane protein